MYRKIVYVNSWATYTKIGLVQSITGSKVLFYGNPIRRYPISQKSQGP